MNRIDRGTRWIGPGAVGILSCAVLLVPACAPDSGSTVGGPQAAERGQQVFNDNCGV
jgi:hypothetical protein